MSEDAAFDRIIYFGDSLTDTGAFFQLSSQLLAFPLPSAVFGYDGQFSNGDVYADIAPQLLGAEVSNYAVGGARAVGVNLVGQALAASPLALPNPDPALLQFDSNLGGQIGRFTADAAGLGDLSGSAASFFIGLNDLNALASTIDPATFDPAAFTAAAQALSAQIIGSTLSAAATAAGLGVGTIILNTLPPGSFFPLVAKGLPPSLLPLADSLVASLNDALVSTAKTQLAPLGVEIKVVDFAAIAQEISADGGTFGFQTVTEQHFVGTGADPQVMITPGGPMPFFPTNPAVDGLAADQFAFWDLLHPTTATHGVLGAFSAASLTSELHLGTAGADHLRVGNGQDLVLARDGDDRVNLGKGDDVGLAGLGNDWISGGRGDDIVSGGSGHDRVFGGRGTDVVAGGAGDDALYAGRGDDVVIDGLGSDIAFGGAGDDLFIFIDPVLSGGSAGESRDLFFGGGGHDTLLIAVDGAAPEGPDLSFGPLKVFDAVGLATVGIEEVIFFDRGTLPTTLDLDDDQAAALAAADLWGFV